MLPSSSSSSSPSASRRYESLEELLKQAGYKETRIFTPQRPPQSQSYNNKSGTKSGSVRDVLKLFSSWVKGDDDNAQPTLRHTTSVPHMRGRRPQHQHQHQYHHQQAPVPTWFTSLFSQITTSQRGSRTAPSTPNGKRRARPLPALLSNPRRPTTSHVSVTMSSVVCRPHSASRSASKCLCHSGKRSDSTSTSSVSVFEVGLHTVSSRSSSTQAEGSSASSRTSAGSALFGAKSPTLHSRSSRVRASTGVPLLVSELQCPSRSGCRVCSHRDSALCDQHHHQPEIFMSVGKGHGCAKAFQYSTSCQQTGKDAMFHSSDESRRRFIYDSDDYHDNYDDNAHDNEHIRRINFITPIDADERMTVENMDIDGNEEDDDDDDDDRIDLARILIPPRRQHSILSLREVLHMDAKRTTETNPASRLLQVNRRTMSNQNLPPNITPRKKATLPPRFFEFRDGYDGVQSSTFSISAITPPSSPLQQKQHARRPQPPHACNTVESYLEGGSRTGYSQSSLPARMRNVKTFEGTSLWEEPESEVSDVVQNDSHLQTSIVLSSKNRAGLGIINLNTSSRRGRGISPLEGRIPNQASHHGALKRRGAITSLWNADPIQ